MIEPFPEQNSQESFCNTFLYGIDWKGNCLAHGQLTTRSLWGMRKRARAAAAKPSNELERLRDQAQAGFDLLAQTHLDSNFLAQMTPGILASWAAFLAYSAEFSALKDDDFENGAHLVIVSWRSSDGRIHMSCSSQAGTRKLGEDELRAIAQAATCAKAAEDPEQLPSDYTP